MAGELKVQASNGAAARFPQPNSRSWQCLRFTFVRRCTSNRGLDNVFSVGIAEMKVTLNLQRRGTGPF